VVWQNADLAGLEFMKIEPSQTLMPLDPETVALEVFDVDTAPQD
jgi:hypothetical protein